MSSEAPKVTIEFLIEMLKQVIEENPSRGESKAAVEAWGPDTLLEDTGFSSYDLVEIIFKLEDHFGIKIDYTPTTPSMT
nr:phosphopantetheine-binding protein [Methylobacterium sp. ZNC0032]